MDDGTVGSENGVTSDMANGRSRTPPYNPEYCFGCGEPSSAIWSGSGCSVGVCSTCAMDVLPAMIADAVDLEHESLWDRLKGIRRQVSERLAWALKDTTIDAHLGHLQAALRWAVGNEYLRKMPKMHRPKRVKGKKFARGRALVGEEYERMLKACKTIRPYDYAVWQRFIEGLWLSGLRLEESLTLSLTESGS